MADKMIIDCHGHYTTEPKDLHRFRKDQIAAVEANTLAALPSRSLLKISDDEASSRINYAFSESAGST